MTSTSPNATTKAPREAAVTLRAAADAFLSSPRCENANTRRAYTGVIDKITSQLGASRLLDDISNDEIAAVLEGEWASAHESTWNRNRAAVNAWLTWCRERQRWPAPAVPGSCERRKEHVDATKDLPKAAIERQLSRRDVPLREKTLWRMLYETAARASEILALDVEQLDLEHRRAPIRSKGGEIEWVHWGTGTAHLLPRLLRLPDGSSRASGPLFLAKRKPVPARRPPTRDICPHTGRARLGYDRARILLKDLTGWQLHQLRHSAATHLGDQKDPLQLIMAKTRHKSPRTAMRYVNPSPTAVAEVTELLAPPRRKH
ncbi:MAG: tyrosine-type recombinase/integrase [Solirubrobacteraceae bacterium]